MLNLLTKFESKSNRVKGVAFHPTQPLLAASLHNGSIQLWNYQMGTLVDRFDQHDGPVRGISFHNTQPLLASGGDDYKVKVWNYKTRRCLFTLHGHLDYVRTVFFHHTHPWILTASDDQTIRIWNWQSRTCIAILTGHNHYIMCAQWHPTDDLVVSASMDQTVRVWDISGLRKKNTTAFPMSLEEQMQRANAGQSDLFGSMDATTKFVLEGHDRGVNWVTFHPSLPLILSAGDDRQIKLWRMSDTKAWEVDTCRGHFNNVSSALFHPRHELIISNGEDKTIRVWDMSKRAAVQTFRREHDRFWVLTVHPELNLFAAGHDNGLIVFKLERERPAFSLHQNTLYYVRDKVIRQHDLSTGSDAALLSIKKLGNAYTPPRSLSFNPAEKGVLVASPADGGSYDLATLPRYLPNENDLPDSSIDGKRGAGQNAVFVARNRIAVLNKEDQSIEIRDLSNNMTKSVKCPVQTNEIFYGGTATLLLAGPTQVVLFEIQQQKILSELNCPPVKYVVWSADGSMVALLSKHTITLTNKTLTSSSLIHETIRIKSASFDENGILIYTTLNHIKYALPQGDNGIIKTLQQPVYLVKVKGKTAYCLDRSAKPRQIEIDPTEYRFKLALIKGKYDEVLHIIRTSTLVGQSIIAYLQRKGYPEIALHFVQDKSTRFDLAIECGNLDVALEEAKGIDREDVWERLSQQALKQGNHKIVEIAYQKTKNFDKLSFLYLTTGHAEKLKKMQKIADMRGDQMSRFHNSLYLGDAEARARILIDVGMLPLAYMTAKSNGLNDLADEIAGMKGVDQGKLAKIPATQSQLQPPAVVHKTYEENWPSLSSQESYFDKALEKVLDQAEDVNELDTLDEWANPEEYVGGADAPMDEGVVEQAEEGDTWDLSDEDVPVEEPEEDEDEFVNAPNEVSDNITAEEAIAAEPGKSEAELWTRNSPLAADHIAAGSFDSAMQLLHRQVGAVNFEPLKPLFMEIYQSSRLYAPANANQSPFTVYLRRDPRTTDPKSYLPVTGTLSLQSIASNELQEGYRLFKAGKFVESAAAFKSILIQLLLVSVSSQEETKDIRDIINVSREYLIGLTLEIERRRLVAEEPSNVKRILELAAYFAECELQPAHSQLALRSAANSFEKAGNTITAGYFAKKLLDLSPTAANVVAKAKSQVNGADRNPRSTIQVDFDDKVHFRVCPASLTPVHQDEDVVEDAYTGAVYHANYSGSLCALTGVNKVGAQCTGLRSIV
ncbi:hypothetical protein E3P86_01655 [Wallemia ichthyophaga]|uniref:Coatomer subunit alpha n=1 Tax=Wallemia ichthyophaga TaxID=245174 RepID=A0A4T0J8B6_WALIC|nr:hypothetical protein E3P86_01655 [Wallemia ichthyophaga]